MKRIMKLTNRPMTRYLKGFVKICNQDQCVALLVPIKNGNDTARKTVFTKSSRYQPAFRRIVSISFNQDMTRFQVEMLWDAKLATITSNAISSVAPNDYSRLDRSWDKPSLRTRSTEVRTKRVRQRRYYGPTNGVNTK